MAPQAAFAILDSVEIPMRDGTILRADIWLPDHREARPVLLQRTAYRKEDAFGTQYISALDFRAALRRGYAIVVQDTRGRYASDGVFRPFADEAADGVDTLARLREQEFCNGKVMMFGASYVGATQILAASKAPEGLVAVSAHLTTGRYGETRTYRGWGHRAGFPAALDHGIAWSRRSAATAGLSFCPRRRTCATPPGEMQQSPSKVFARLPVLDDDLPAPAPYAAGWFNHDRAASSGADRENLDAPARSALPYLVSGGWNDLFLEGTIELFETVRRRWVRPEDVRDRLIIGPRSHGNPSDWQGDFWFGYSASTDGLPEEQLQFFDAARTGSVPSSPMVRYFRSGSNTRHGAPDWPLPGTQRRDLHLSPECSGAPAVADWSCFYRSDPLDPVPTTGGANFIPGLLMGRNSGPKDRATVEQRPDVATFTSAPLEAELEVTGLVEAALWVSSSGPSSDWTARLCVVEPSGRSIGLVDGITRRSDRAGSPTEVTVRLGHISHLFSKGSRLRLQVASSNYPRFDRNPQSGVPSTDASTADFRIASQTIQGGPTMPSRLTIPVPARPFPSRSGLAERDATAPSNPTSVG
ncbi:CocE/NonD family hydrolase [Devosia sp. A8/3-2]|nr:CocE/NonD family hydrolase [Devosia sp. A8/3-2]